MVNTKKIAGILTVMLLSATVAAFSGCVFPGNAAPTPQPVVTILPTPTPSATPTTAPAPAPVDQQKSPDVKILNIYGDRSGIVGFNFTRDSSHQKEAITVMVRNEGSNMAKNVVLGLTETDARSGNPVSQQQYSIGDLSRGETREYTMQTDEHDPVASVYITVGITWGENGEYVSPVTYVNTAKTIWMADYTP